MFTDGKHFIKMLDIPTAIMDKVDVLHPTLIWDEDTVILVDAGVPGQLPLLSAAMQEAGAPFERLTRVIITHQDLDHIGSLPAILQEAPGSVEVLAAEVEKPYIQGERRLVKLSPEAIAQAVASLPPEVPEERRRAFRAVLENPPKAGVDQTLADGETLPDCGGITVITTPGHTPGHICLYHHPSKTLVAGDALRVEDGHLLGPAPELAYDSAEAVRSLQKLARYDVETVICYHGGLYRGDANRHIAEIAQG